MNEQNDGKKAGESVKPVHVAKEGIDLTESDLFKIEKAKD